ncbi:MAG: hypothetical protein U0640_09900 [Phycisphaerales bacterium]
MWISKERKTVLKRDPILISLSPTSLRVGILSAGEVVRSERVCLSTSVEEAWATGLRPLDDGLRETLQTLHVKPGTPAVVLYHSPRSVAEVFNVPASGNAAEQAVELYLQQNLPNSGEGWLTQHQLIQEDKSTDEDGKPASSTAPTHKQTTALTYADSSNDADTLAHFIRRAGLNVAGIMPAKAAKLRNSLQNPPERDEDTPSVFIHLGEHAMTLTAWSGKKLLLARCAEVGYSLLVDALLRSASSALKSDSVTREVAIRTLFACGLPLPGEMLDSSLGLSGDAVLPSIQPAMQRYVIEIRQTLRFGMLESDVARARVLLTGPGSAIPNLAESLSESLEIDVARLGQDRTAGGGISDELVGDLVIAKWLANQQGWIVPPSVQVARTSLRTGQAVRYGGVAAALLLGVLATRAFMGTNSMKSAVASMKPQADAIDARLAARAQAAKAAQAMERINSLIAAGLGPRTDWRTVLGTLAQILPPGMELDEITGDYSSGEVTGTPALVVKGRSPQVDANGASPTSQFIDALVQSPLVLSARVTNSRNNEANGLREFTISIQLRSVQVAGPLSEPIDVPQSPNTASTQPEVPTP